MPKAIYPGSFDPLTFGHLDIIERAHKIFGLLTVLVSKAENKNYLFTLDERLSLIQENLRHLANVKVEIWNGLTVDYMEKHGSQILVRGLRNTDDFEQEKMIALANKKLNSHAETVFIISQLEHSMIASRIVKEIARNGGALTSFVPKNVEQAILKRMSL